MSQDLAYLTLPPGDRHVFQTAASDANDSNLQSVLLNHVCFRIRSPKRSLAFFADVLGYSPLFAWNIGPQIVIFLYKSKEGESKEDVFKSMQSRHGLIELIWDQKERSDDELEACRRQSDFSASYFHIGITVDNVQDILDRAARFGSPIRKQLGVPTSMVELGCAESTPMFVQGCETIFAKVAFLEDPDGNWIELVPKRMH